MAVPLRRLCVAAGLAAALAQSAGAASAPDPLESKLVAPLARAPEPAPETAAEVAPEPGSEPGSEPAAGPGAAQQAGAGAVGAVTSLPLPRYVSLRGSEANARRGPSTSQRVDWTFVRRGLPLLITAEYGNWRRVQDAEGAGGWVHYMLLSGVRTALVQGDAPLPLRAKAEEGAQIRAFAEPGVIAKVEHCRDAWCELESGAVKGWVPRAALWGVTPDETID